MNNTCLSKNNNMGRPLKKNVYNSQCEQIINKLDAILFSDLNNRSFFLYHLENDIEKQNKIIQLESDVKKYMVSSSWVYFCKQTSKIYLSLLLSIYKYMNYQILKSQSTLPN